MNDRVTVTQSDRSNRNFTIVGVYSDFSSMKEDGKIDLISYEENQFGWAKKQLVSRSINEVENETDSVLVAYSDDLKWKFGDTFVLTTLLSVVGPVKKINKMDIVNVINAQ